MKRLVDYLNERYERFENNHYAHSGNVSIIENNELIDLLWPDGDCPQYIIDGIIGNSRYFDPVLENLNSHDWKKLKKYIEDEYDVVVHKNHDNDNKDSISIVCNNEDDANYIISDDKFKKCLKFYNYNFTQKGVKNKNVILVDPIYSEKVDIDNDNLNRAQAYHITTKKNANKILKTGLRLRNGNKNNDFKYREFPERIYLILPEKYSDGIELISKAITMKGMWNDYAVLKINLAKVKNYNFYKDVGTNNPEHYIYTYANIHKDLITDITEKIRPKIEKFEKEHG